MGAFPTCFQVQYFPTPETWSGTPSLCGTLGTQPACTPSLPDPKPAHLAPHQRWGKAPQCLWQLLLPRHSKMGALLWLSEGVEAATQCGGVSCAVQPACTFSCFVLKYPLVSFFTSHSLYPKLCISPSNGAVFLIAGRVLLLDSSLLLMHCVALQKAR